MVLNGKTKKTSENKTDVLVADVDECGATFSPCRWWAVCVNTLGSYSCHCRKGYRGKQCDVGKYSVYINPSLPLLPLRCTASGSLTKLQVIKRNIGLMF